MDMLESTHACSSRGLVRRKGGGQQLVAPLRVDLSGCKYGLLQLVAARLGWQVVAPGSPDSQWDLFWTDTSISQERLLRLAPTQRINHFHGMLELCRKRSMARLLAGLAAAAPPGCSYDFFPPTWQLPGQLGDFLAAAKAASRKATFIVKPDAGCQGKGIKLLQGGSEAAVLRSLADMATLQAVTQTYIPQPLLIHGLKFDLRVYVLVADVDPLRVFIYKEGLVRFCTAPYSKPTARNLGCAYMHLTNYAVNKHNAEAFVTPGSSGSNRESGRGTNNSAADSSSGDEADNSQAAAQQECRAGTPVAGSGAEAASKWSFSQLRQHLDSQGHSWSGLWSSISQLVVKSLAAATPHLAATYRTTVVSSGSTTMASRPGGAATCPGSCSRPRSDAGTAPVAASSAAVAAGCCRCFEVLGYDVLLDVDLKPWLVEVNHSPSFNVDSPLDRSIKEALLVDAVRLLRIEPGSMNAAKQAARKATQARLLAPPPARGSSSSAAGGPASSGCSADAKAAQQAHRDAIIAARDRWQDKHLGNFERIYPVPMPGQQAGNIKIAAAAADTTSPAKLSEPAQLQQTYEQLLAVSQQLYSQQLQQQHQPRLLQQQPTVESPVRNKSQLTGGQQHSPSSKREEQQQQQQQQQQVELSRELLTRPEVQEHHQQQHHQQQQDTDDAAKHATSLCSDGEGDQQGRARGQTCSEIGQHVSVASALAMLTAALARPDVPHQHRSRPASAGSRQQISRAACSLLRPQSASTTGSSSSSSSSAPRLHNYDTAAQHQSLGPHTSTGAAAAGLQHPSQASSVLHTSRNDNSRTGGSSSSTKSSSRYNHWEHTRSPCCESPGAVRHPVASRPRPASAPRLRGRSDVVGSNGRSSSSSSSRAAGDQAAQPMSSSSRQHRSGDVSSNLGSATSIKIGGSSKQQSATQQAHEALAATHRNSSSSSSSSRQRSASCSGFQEERAAEANTAEDNAHNTKHHNNTPVLSSGLQQHSSREASMHLIAAAIQEATAALEAAATATFSNVHTPRPAAVSTSGLAVGENDYKIFQQPGPVHDLASNSRLAAAQGLSKYPLQCTMHSKMMGAHADQWQPQQCSMMLSKSSVNRSALAYFSSFQGSELSSRHLETLIDMAKLPKRNSGSNYINSLLQQQEANRGASAWEATRAADDAVPWNTCALPQRHAAANCQQRPGAQRSSSDSTGGLHGVHNEWRQQAAGEPGAGQALQLTSTAGSMRAAAEGMAGAVVLGSGIRSGGQRPLLRHCSTGRLLGRLRLAEVSGNAA
ncbi:tubulin-tyrosine ligase family-domain-containing protein [Scenedesmus sp. NREL 46B-D3]|nr:tubulin-tyrosine ligase family-domain-containing protein [Scenedesmus sp. NREL 46B-D3]